jgi:plastocyanin
MKLALVACGMAVCSLVSAGANTIQVQVAAGGLKFTPQDVTINVGDTVQWVWVGSGHSSTSGTPGHPDGLWDSGVQNAGFTFNHTFNTAGTFSYYCTPHGLCCGMVGSVTVNQAVDTVTITKALYQTSRMQLTVQATDTNSTAVLTVTKTSDGTILGTMRNLGNGSYSAKIKRIANPEMITVTSNLGGSDTETVRVR